MPNKTWIITTSADRPIKDVAKDLEDAGFSVGNVNDEIQSITGAASEAALDKLRSISGVVDVSPDEPIDVGPPGSPDTW
jgi:predicted CoA-binding protein